MIIKNYECLAEPSEYSQSFKDMVEKSVGHDGRVNREIIQANFPMNGRELGTKSKVRFTLIHFDDQTLSSDEILDEFSRLNLLPARLRDLLIFSEKYPEEQATCPIIALGATWKNQVPYLSISCERSGINGRKRNLSIIRANCRWVEQDGFLAIELVDI